MTVQPSKQDFVELAGEHGVVPVYQEVLADYDTPLSVYDKLSGNGASFLLESAEHGERWGRYSFVGIEPMLTLRGDRMEVTWDGEPPAVVEGAEGPLDALNRITATLTAPDLPGLPPLHTGAVGYVGYDAVRENERIPDTGEDDLALPDVMMLFPRHIVGLDHLRQTMTVVTNVVVGEDPAGQYDAAVAANQAVVERLQDPRVHPSAAPPTIGDPVSPQSNMSPSEYEAMVDRVKEYILAGDTFQTVVSQRFSIETSATPMGIYRMLRVINPSPYLFMFDFDGFHLIGSSPEALVQVHGDHVETWPIAGTRARGSTPDEDLAIERELLADPKERSEHVMLVDLGRNDLGRVCEPGSVRVEDMMVVERYSHVMHIVSSVVGSLREGLGPVDVLRAVFPAGTVSGAPKVRAMEIIDELEPTRRGIYSGAVGYVDFSGNLDTCIAIRTVVLKDGIAYVQAGAGIVADSVPAKEEQETRDKAGAVLAAVLGAERLQRES